MRKRFMSAAIAAAMLLGAAPAFAHHSVSAQFDVDKMVMKKAVLSKIEWINPHPYLTFDMTEADGTSHKFAGETLAPAALRRAGLAGREALKVGDTYTLYFHPARNGSNTIGLLSAFTLPDGKMIVSGSTKVVEQIKALQKTQSATN
jgi:Family of unknown function (DUF6152)